MNKTTVEKLIEDLKRLPPQAFVHIRVGPVRVYDIWPKYDPSLKEVKL